METLEQRVVLATTSPFFLSGLLPANGGAGTQGTVLFGSDANDLAGGSVSGAGDVNGDGFADFIVGARNAEVPNNATDNSGESYVVFGRATGWPATFNLADLATGDGSRGFRILGVDANDRSGASVRAAGDVNGDGFGDLIVGAYAGDGANNGAANAGESYVVFGKSDWSQTPSLGVSSLSGSNGFTLLGSDADDQAGFSVSGIGDFNGDNFDDLLIGAYQADGANNVSIAAGESYVVFGKADWSGTATFNLGSLTSGNGSQGFTIFGAAAAHRSGRSVSGAGDVNGDSLADLIIGATNAANNAGESYVVFGTANLFGGPLSLASLNGTNGFKLVGVDANDQSGRAVSAAGDVNGDGFGDLLIGAPDADGDNNAALDAGESYVVFGQQDWSGTPALNLADLNGFNGFTLLGIDADDKSGSSVSAAGDVNGDGFADLLIGAPGGDGANNGVANAGESYLIFGKSIWTLTHRVGLAGLNGLNGLALLGVDADDRSGLAVSGAGDVNGDGFGDLLIGARDADGANNGVGNAGEAYLILGNQGATYFGVDAEDRSGGDVSSAGDVNGDGFDDFLIGAWGAYGPNNGTNFAGEVYVVFGRPEQTLPPTALLGELDGTNGFQLTGALAYDLMGYSVSAAGDVNGDGFDDLLVAARNGSDYVNYAQTYSGKSYVVFGKADWSQTPALAPANLDGTNGFTLVGVDTFDLCNSVSGAGDVNGDGFADLLIGAPYADGTNNGLSASGEAYLVFGKASGWTAAVNLSTLDGTSGVAFFGIDADDQAGRSVSGAGDVNGDGFADLLIGAPYADGANNDAPYTGEAYLVFGKATGWTATVNLADLDGTSGVRFFGVDADDRSGWSVSGAGDVNGDGFADLLIGAPYADGTTNAALNTGEAYLVFGKATGWSAAVNLSTLDGTSGVALFGIDADDRAGRSVSGAGDVNGDGFADLLIGAPYADGTTNAAPNTGEAYLVFGFDDWTGLGQFDLSFLELFAEDGLILRGRDAGDRTGHSVSSAGDVNGDGFADLLLGAPYAYGADNGTSNAGEARLFFGGNFTNSLTHAGSPAADTLTGTNAADVLVGGRANDTLVGAGGADVAYGGQGDDVLAVSDMSFRRVAGGHGLDTLRLDGSGQHLNLTTLPDSRLTSIEIIDLRGSGANTLTLNLREVLNLTSGSSSERTANTLTIRRNADDTVNKGSGWTQAADVTVAGVKYNVFTQGPATLRIESLNTPPVFTSASSRPVVENTTGVHTLTATDGDLPAQTLTFSLIAGGADNAKFRIDNGNQLRFITAPDFENPTDADANNVYVVRVQVSDGAGGTATQTINVTVTNINPSSVADRYVLGSSGALNAANQSVLSNDAGGPNSAARTAGPTKGALVLNATGTFNFTPGNGFHGYDEFKYRPSRGGETGAEATVQLFSHTGALVAKAYQTVLGRPFDLPGLEFWVQRIDGGEGLSAFAIGVFESRERLEPIIKSYYRDYLGRTTDPSQEEIDFYYDQWRREGGPQFIEPNFFASQEFYQNQGGGTDAGWVAALYQIIVGRIGTQPEINFHLGRLQQGVTRQGIVAGFLYAPENLEQTIRSIYGQILSRQPTAAELAAQVAAMAISNTNPKTQKQLQLELLDSAEFSSVPAKPNPGQAVRF